MRGREPLMTITHFFDLGINAFRRKEIAIEVEQ
jgi:hypothetical protein